MDLEIAPGVVTRWMKMAIRNRVTSDLPQIAEASAVNRAVELTETDADRLS